VKCRIFFSLARRFLVRWRGVVLFYVGSSAVGAANAGDATGQVRKRDGKKERSGEND
jgi:hypothetical protein